MYYTTVACLLNVLCTHSVVSLLHVCFTYCSAGVGRTGCFLALDNLMLHIRDHDWVDIFGLACEMRQHRNHMIQTEVSSKHMGKRD